MTDNQIMIGMILEIERQLGLVDFTSFEVSQDFQPTNQFAGANADSEIKTQIFLHSITNPSLGVSRKYSDGTGLRTDFQHRNKVIQVSVLHFFDQSDINSLTPQDVTTLVHDLINSPDAISALRVKGINLQDVGDVRPVFSVNETDRNESTPNFDLTIAYQGSITKKSGYVDNVVPDVKRV